jgi:hypothetical protein
MSETSDETSDDELLPEDLKPGEDNPLAEGLGEGETAGDLGPGELLDEGKEPDQRDGDDAEREADGCDGGDGGGGEGSVEG